MIRLHKVIFTCNPVGAVTGNVDILNAVGDRYVVLVARVRPLTACLGGSIRALATARRQLIQQLIYGGYLWFHHPELQFRPVQERPLDRLYLRGA